MRPKDRVWESSRSSKPGAFLGAMLFNLARAPNSIGSLEECTVLHSRNLSQQYRKDHDDVLHCRDVVRFTENIWEAL